MQARTLIQATDLCVKCGLCVSQCPTYAKTLDENESPRGRISLIQAWSAGALEDTRKLHRHIDRCLLCGTCESVCPAQVPYSKIIDEFRSATKHLRRSPQLPGFAALAGLVLSNPGCSAIALRFARAVRSSPLMKFLPRRFRATRLLRSFLQDLSFQNVRHGFYPTRFPKQGVVGLFAGCTANWFDAESAESALRVLNRVGYDVWIPARQHCCGALDLHAGQAPRARELAQQNLRTFEERKLDAIVTLASGCGAALRQYPDFVADSAGFASKVFDISEWVMRSGRLSEVSLEAMPKEVLIHAPCSLKNGLKSAQAPNRLLGEIPMLRISLFDPSIRCCGAAGNYMLEQPELADSLLGDLLDQIVAKKPAYVLTSNVGCALHIRSGLRGKAIDFEVLHPIVLFDRLIKNRQAPELPPGQAVAKSDQAAFRIS